MFEQIKKLMRKQKKKYVAAYCISDSVIVVSQEQHSSGALMEVEPLYYNEIANNNELIGDTLRKALCNFRLSKITVYDYEKVKELILKYAKVSSYKKFIEEALYCGITMDENIVISPTHNGGTRGNKKGFTDFGGMEPVNLSITSTNEQLGSALIEGFHLCTRRKTQADEKEQ